MPVPDIPERFNAAAFFLDRHVVEGRGDRVALRWNGQAVTYAQLAANVNRAGNALRRLGVRAEERVVLAMLDGPEFAYSFWGAMKIGAVPVPVNTALRTDEYAYVLDDSRARVIISSQEVFPMIAPVTTPWLRQRIVVGRQQAEIGSGECERVGCHIVIVARRDFERCALRADGERRRDLGIARGCGSDAHGNQVAGVHRGRCRAIRAAIDQEEQKDQEKNYRGRRKSKSPKAAAPIKANPLPPALTSSPGITTPESMSSKPRQDFGHSRE
jgi:hypothetical protein